MNAPVRCICRFRFPLKVCKGSEHIYLFFIYDILFIYLFIYLFLLAFLCSCFSQISGNTLTTAAAFNYLHLVVSSVIVCDLPFFCILFALSSIYLAYFSIFFSFLSKFPQDLREWFALFRCCFPLEQHSCCLYTSRKLKPNHLLMFFQQLLLNSAELLRFPLKYSLDSFLAEEGRCVLLQNIQNIF